MQDLTQKLAALDLSEEAAQLDDLKQQASELNNARERGHQRMLEIAREIEALRAGRGDGEAAAEALLSGANVALASPQEQALEEERQAIKAGMANLVQREREISHKRAGIIDIVDSKSAAAVECHVADLERRAKTLATELAQIYGDADALGHAGCNARAVRLSASLRDGLQGFRHVDKLIDPEVSVTPDLVRALEASPARPLLRRHVPSTVRII